MDDEVQAHYFPDTAPTHTPVDILFDEHTPRAELIEALTHLAARAHSREQHVIGTKDYPTRWDKAHATIDRMLLLLEAR